MQQALIKQYIRDRSLSEKAQCGSQTYLKQVLNGGIVFKKTPIHADLWKVGMPKSRQNDGFFHSAWANVDR
jgi:hypothetical protein